MSKAAIERACANLVELSASPPARVQLLPMGRITPRDGRKPWLLKDRAHADRVVAASMAWAGQTQLMIDYDHQSVFGAQPGVGGRAPAAAWMTRLSVEDDGIWADVDWNGPAAAALQAREYRYLSPVFDFDKATGEVIRVLSAALTNTPALSDLAAVASADLNTQQPGDSSVSKAIAAALGLAETATEDDILKALQDRETATAAASAERGQIAQALGLTGEVKTDALVKAAGTATAAAAAKGAPDPEKFVPKEGYDDVVAQLKVINAERAAASVDAAIEAGQLVPAMRDWGLALFDKDQTAWASFLAAAPPVVTPGAGLAAGKRDDTSAQTLTDTERATCAALGWDETEFLKTKLEDAA